MNQSNSVMVQYVGSKDLKSDNVAGSSTVWRGQGDVQPVSQEVWGKLSKHTDVWRIAEPPPATPLAEAAEQGKAEQQPEKRQAPTATPATKTPAVKTAATKAAEQGKAE